MAFLWQYSRNGCNILLILSPCRWVDYLLAEYIGYCISFLLHLQINGRLIPLMFGTNCYFAIYNILTSDQIILPTYIRTDVSWHRRSDLENDKIDAIWLKISISESKPVLICFVYRPADTSEHLIKDFDDVFLT